MLAYVHIDVFVLSLFDVLPDPPGPPVPKNFLVARIYYPRVFFFPFFLLLELIFQEVFIPGRIFRFGFRA